MRGDESFAYDLIVSFGAVNSRVVLLLRSIEAKPVMTSICIILPIRFALRSDLKGFTFISQRTLKLFKVRFTF